MLDLAPERLLEVAQARIAALTRERAQARVIAPRQRIRWQKPAAFQEALAAWRAVVASKGEWKPLAQTERMIVAGWLILQEDQ
jgi:hypothetical protein